MSKSTDTFYELILKGLSSSKHCEILWNCMDRSWRICCHGIHESWQCWRFLTETWANSSPSAIENVGSMLHNLLWKSTRCCQRNWIYAFSWIYPLWPCSKVKCCCDVNSSGTCLFTLQKKAVMRPNYLVLLCIIIPDAFTRWRSVQQGIDHESSIPLPWASTAPVCVKQLQFCLISEGGFQASEVLHSPKTSI